MLSGIRHYNNCRKSDIIMYLSSKEVRAKKPIHLPPKEEGVFLEILDKFVFKSHLKMNDQLVLVLKL